MDVESPSKVSQSRSQRLLLAPFGDRYGLALFLGTLTVLGLALRLDVLINDSFVMLNTLVNLGDGRLALVERPFGDATNPGLHLLDGRYYGRNYGQAAAAVPFLHLFRFTSFFAPIRVVLVGLWALVALGFVGVTASLVDRSWSRPAGLLAVGALTVPTLVLDPLWGKGDPATAALLVVSVLAGAISVVLVYRIVATWHPRRVAVAAGVLALLATPLPLWAVLGKRHALDAALVLLSVFGFVRSRTVTAGRLRRYRACRALAYAAVGLQAWLHAPEAVTVFLVLVAVDLPTAPRNDPRTLGIVAGVFLASLLPSLATNTLIAGNPFEPPRFLPGYDGPTGSVGGGGGSGGFADLPLVSAVAGKASALVGRYWDGTRLLVTDGSRLARVFIWHGAMPAGPMTPPIRPGTNLSVLSSMPVLGLGGVALGTAARYRGRIRSRLRKPTPVSIYLLGLCGGYLILFLPSLPLWTQFTVRYLHPIYPLGLILLTRSSLVGDVIAGSIGTIWRVAAATAVLVSPALYLLMYTAELHTGEILQVHAASNLAAAGMLALLAITDGYRGHGSDVLPITTGFAVGVTGALFSNLLFVYLHFGQSLLPVVETVTRTLWEAILF
mgnify:CR=1 FL=1